METAFGPGSPIFTQTTERLSQIFAQAGHFPPVAARFREWRRSWQSIHTQDPPQASAGEELFIHQTYLALLARLTARRFIAPTRPISGDEELLEIINCDYFSRRGIGNFGEGDLFSWVCLEPRWESGLDDLFLDTMRGLSEAMIPYDFSGTLPGIMDGLYYSIVPDAAHPPPRWLAEYVVQEELGLAEDPSRSLLDPACGTGVFLTAAIRTISKTMTEHGADPLDVLFGMPQLVRGMDRDPLAITLARLNYLLAMGGSVQQDHPPILVPVYLADAAQVSESYPVLPRDVAVVIETPVGKFPLPDPVIKNPMMLDWVLGRLTNYMDAAYARLHAQSEEEAVQEVMNAYYNYLTAPKPRTPVPDPLTPTQADILLETARSLVKLHIQGEGTLWLHMVQNNAASEAFARTGGSDLIAGCGSLLHLEMSSFRYLKGSGRTAMLLPIDQATSGSAGRRLVGLDGVMPGSALLVSGLEQRVRLEPVGGPISADISWDEAKPTVRVVNDTSSS
ncbi:MAG: hypothetical protein O2913_01245 [Chloroflexi bacterium]|nr:hypothetical protein [Chloroflexota bacterium]